MSKPPVCMTAATRPREIASAGDMPSTGTVPCVRLATGPGSCRSWWSCPLRWGRAARRSRRARGAGRCHRPPGSRRTSDGRRAARWRLGRSDRRASPDLRPSLDARLAHPTARPLSATHREHWTPELGDRVDRAGPARPAVTDRDRSRPERPVVWPGALSRPSIRSPTVTELARRPPSIGRSPVSPRIRSPSVTDRVPLGEYHRRVQVTAEAARRFLVARHGLAPARSLAGGSHGVLEVLRRLGVDPIRPARGRRPQPRPRATRSCRRLRPRLV